MSSPKNKTFRVYLLADSLDSRVHYEGAGDPVLATSLGSRLKGRVFYVGKEGSRYLYRFREHLRVARAGYAEPVHEKIREILSAGGKVLCEAVFETDEEFFAFDEEVRLIRAFGRCNLTNLTDGGEGATGAVQSRDVVERRAAKLRGNKYPWLAERNKTLSKDPEVRRKISEARKRGFVTGRIKSPMLGRKASPETIARLRESHLGKKPTNLEEFVRSGHEALKARAAERGYWHSAETRRKIGEAQRGRKHSAETRAKQSAAWRPSVKRSAARVKLWLDPEYRARVSASVKRSWEQRKAKLAPESLN